MWGHALGLVIIDVTILCLLVAFFVPDHAFREALPILSNGAFLLPACEAWHRGRYTRFMINLLIIVSSSMYHACYAFDSACHLSPTLYRALDFFFAQLTIPLTALYIVRFPSPRYAWIERVAIITFGFCIAIVQATLGQTMYIQMVIVFVSLCIIMTYWLVYQSFHHHLGGGLIPDIYNWRYFGPAISLSCISCVLFATQTQTPSYYWAIHSVWHVTAAMSQYALLRIHKDPDDQPQPPSYVVLDYPVRSRVVTIRHVTPRSRIM